MKENKPMNPHGAPKARAEKSAQSAGIKKKHGIYMAALSALVVAIVIVFNLLVGSLPEGTLEYDISEKDIYTVTQQSVDYLRGLDKDVSIVVLAQDAAIDEHVLKFINNYVKLSGRITLTIIDPVLNPAALETYEAEENDILVSCAATNKTRTLKLDGMYGYDEALILYDPQAAAYYGQYKPVAIDAEGQLTSAINYVTSEQTHKLYYLEGHGESPLGTTASDAISKSNIETASLNLLKEGSIPSDCELIVSFNPANDLVSDELDMLETYLKTGGNVMLLLDNPELPNYNTLLETYGLQMKAGYIGDYNNYYSRYFNDFGYFCIYPELSAGSDVTASITGDAIVIGSRGLLEITPLRRGAAVSAFMTTSEQGFLDADENSEGRYILGATSVETFENVDDTESRLTVIAAINLVSDQISTSFSNIDIFMNAVNLNFGEINNTVIPPKSLDVGTVTVSHPAVWNVLFIGLIPLAFIGGGLIYWIRRRNR